MDLLHNRNTDMKESATNSGNTHHQMYQNYIEALTNTFAKTIGFRDPSLLAHSRRVAEIAVQLATVLQLHQDQMELIEKAGLFHDIGKLGVSREILSKSEALSLQEFTVLKSHSEFGAAILQECPEFERLIPIVRHHHEFFNGDGYPDRLAGEQIQIEARIIAVAEAIASMSSDLPYRRSFTSCQIIDELNRCSGTQFDPRVVEAAIKILSEKETKVSN